MACVGQYHRNTLESFAGASVSSRFDGRRLLANAPSAFDPCRLAGRAAQREDTITHVAHRRLRRDVRRAADRSHFKGAQYTGAAPPAARMAPSVEVGHGKVRH